MIIEKLLPAFDTREKRATVTVFSLMPYSSRTLRAEDKKI
jgi:hypothetical protein